MLTFIIATLDLLNKRSKMADGINPERDSTGIGQEGILKGFRLFPKEDEALTTIEIPLAHLLGKIKDRTLQGYMMYALNCAHDDLQKTYASLRGKKT